MTDGVRVQMTNLVQELKAVDKKWASAVRKQVRAAVTEAGADIVAEVRAEASWSSRIPAATTIRPNFSTKSAGVRIVTNRRKAPHARPFEMGNGAGGGDTFVNGTGGQVHVRPFFFTAVKKQTPAAERRMSEAIDKAVRDAGFR